MKAPKLREKGFSLVELILSIAALSILAGFILQMFLTAAQVNVRADEYDQAALLCERAIETALSHDDFTPSVVYLDKYWDETDEEVATYRLSFKANKKGEDLRTPRTLVSATASEAATPEAEEPEAITSLWELRSDMMRIADGKIICELLTRQIVNHPDEEVYAP